jgi:hypothetical protein
LDLITAWSGMAKSSAGRIRSLQNFIFPTFDMLATGQGAIFDINLSLINLFGQTMFGHGKQPDFGHN